MNSIDDYERVARRILRSPVTDYVFGATETGATYSRNLSGFSKYLIRRRVLQGIEEVKTRISYFGRKLEAELPFFPSSINLTPMYPNALLDLFRISRSFRVPIFVSDFAIDNPLRIDMLPRLVPNSSGLIWQLYFLRDNFDLKLKQVALAREWGYAAIAVTVDTESGVKLGNDANPNFLSHEFRSVTLSDIRKVRRATALPLIVKGVMTAQDAAAAVECGADGIVVSNHGGRTMDCGEGSIEALPGIVRYLKSNKATREVEIFFDSGIRRGTDIIKALALGARGCLIGRPYFWALAVDRKNGAESVTRILKKELLRTASLSGIRDLANVDSETIVAA